MWYIGVPAACACATSGDRRLGQQGSHGAGCVGEHPGCAVADGTVEQQRCWSTVMVRTLPGCGTQRRRMSVKQAHISWYRQRCPKGCLRC